MTKVIAGGTTYSAQIVNPVISKSSDQITAPKTYFNNVLQSVFTIFFIVAVIFFMWNFIFGGYRFINSNGDPKNIETARNQITNAFIGLVVIFLVYAILKFVGMVFGITGLDTLTIPWPNLL